MKKLILLFSVASMGLVSCDKEDEPRNEVPFGVLDAFETEFPNAVDVEWETKGSDFEADFEIDKVDYSALINPSGAIEKVKYDILESEFPEEVKVAISANYADKIIDDADVIKIGEELFYQIEFEGGISDTDIILDASGNEAPEIDYWD